MSNSHEKRANFIKAVLKKLETLGVLGAALNRI